MKLAFSGQARYPDMTDGYTLYTDRSRVHEPVTKPVYARIVKDYCRMLAEELERNGMTDLPSGLGTIAAVMIDRRPQFRGKKFVGYGKMNWQTGQYDGEPKAFGLAFLPRRNKSGNLRCYGFVANRKLFKKMKELYDGYDCPWVPMEYGNEMI